MNLPISKVNTLMDAFTHMENKGTQSANKMINTTGRLAGTFSALNFKPKNAVAVSSWLNSLSPDASTAATNFKILTNRLLKTNSEFGYLDRIKKNDDKINAFLTITEDYAIKKAEELTNQSLPIEEKAREIFYFVRDRIRYLFHADSNEDQYLASNILKKKGGFCTQKSILFCALARACDIPAGIYFYDIVDYTLPQHIIDLLQTRTLYRHGIVALYLNGKWLKYDATLDSNLVARNNLIAVEFFPDRDCLMHEKTDSGARHIEYVKNYGLFADVSFDEIKLWFKEYYSHLIK